MSDNRIIDTAAKTAYPGPPAPMRTKVDALAALGEDWDSYGAAPIAPVAIRTASSLMDCVVQQSGHAPNFVGPVPYGGVEIEYRNGNRSIEIDVHPDAKFDVLTSLDDGARAIREVRCDMPLPDVLRMIHSILGE